MEKIDEFLSRIILTTCLKVFFLQSVKDHLCKQILIHKILDENKACSKYNYFHWKHHKRGPIQHLLSWSFSTEFTTQWIRPTKL